jgi:hypothetical protein
MYYILYAPDVVGLQNNVTDLGAIATIDFTGQTNTKANVTLQSDFHEFQWEPRRRRRDNREVNNCLENFHWFGFVDKRRRLRQPACPTSSQIFHG